MNEQQKHEMILEKTHSSGAEEWYCPVCARRFLLQWPPRYERTILNPGDESVTHSGAKGGLSMGRLEISENEKAELPKEIRAAIEKIVEKLDREDSSRSE